MKKILFVNSVGLAMLACGLVSCGFTSFSGSPPSKKVKRETAQVDQKPEQDSLVGGVDTPENRGGANSQPQEVPPDVQPTEVATMPPTLSVVDSEASSKKSCGQVTHGQAETRTMWQASSVPSGSECKSEEQQRICNDGSFGEWNGTFTFTACIVQSSHTSGHHGSQSCGSVPHGGIENRVAYKSASVEFPATCQTENQTRTCNNGSFGSWSGTFSATTCEAVLPRQFAMSCTPVPLNVNPQCGGGCGGGGSQSVCPSTWRPLNPSFAPYWDPVRGCLPPFRVTDYTAPNGLTANCTR